MINPSPPQGHNPGARSAAFASQLAADPYPFYEMLRAAGPVTWLPDVFGLGGWAVVSHAACTSALRSRHFGKEAERILAPEVFARMPRELTASQASRKNNMLFRDPPDHTRLRGLVNLAFTPRTVERLRAHVVEITDRLLDAVEPRGHMDLLRDFAFQLPVIVIAELLGVPAQDRDRFKAWSTDAARGVNPAATSAELQQAARSVDAIHDYLRGVVEERRREPREDLISDLIRAQEAGDQLSTDELVGTARLLLFAGHETTTNLIGNGALALLKHPDQLAALAADPGLLPGAIEEMLRFDAPVQLTARFALEDTTVGEQPIKRGDMVLALLGAANRDPACFADPARLDLRRANARDHLALGGGIHYCLGASLARIEGQIAFGALLRRLPRLALGEGPIEWSNNLTFRGLKALPVTF